MSKAFSNCSICGAEVTRSRKICGVCVGAAPKAVLQKAQSLWYWYRLTFIEYAAMIEAQNERCALCGEPFGTCAKRSPAVDHDHVTDNIRGIVHQACNRGLGHFDDNPVKLELAAAYLRTASSGRSATGRWRESLKRQQDYRHRKRK